MITQNIYNTNLTRAQAVCWDSVHCKDYNAINSPAIEIVCRDIYGLLKCHNHALRRRVAKAKSKGAKPAGSSMPPPVWSVREQFDIAAIASAGPCIRASTRPLGRLRTQPATPSFSACRCMDQRKATPWTRPETWIWRAVAGGGEVGRAIPSRSAEALRA